jgi:hypothetical protein
MRKREYEFDKMINLTYLMSKILRKSKGQNKSSK